MMQRRAKMAGPVRRGFPGLRQPGTILNLYNRPVKPNLLEGRPPSTTVSASFGFPEGEVLLPTVVGGREMTEDEAIARYRQTGQHLGIFDTVEAAKAYARQLHESQEAMGNFYGPTSAAPPATIPKPNPPPGTGIRPRRTLAETAQEQLDLDRARNDVLQYLLGLRQYQRGRK